MPRKHILAFLSVIVQCTRGYRFLDLITNRVYISRHVVFDERNFPFNKNSSSTHSDSTPELVTYSESEAWFQKGKEEMEKNTTPQIQKGTTDAGQTKEKGNTRPIFCIDAPTSDTVHKESTNITQEQSRSETNSESDQSIDPNTQESNIPSSSKNSSAIDTNTLDSSSHTNSITVDSESSSEKLHSNMYALPDISNNLFIDLHVPTTETSNEQVNRMVIR